jgi:hypothetical protein
MICCYSPKIAIGMFVLGMLTGVLLINGVIGEQWQELFQDFSQDKIIAISGLIFSFSYWLFSKFQKKN